MSLKHHPGAFTPDDLWGMGQTPAVKEVVTRLLSFIGTRALAGKPPFDTTLRDGTPRLDGWISDRHHVRVGIRAADHLVEVEVTSGGSSANSTLAIPGEIVGLESDGRYTSVYFSLERGERSANLFSLLNAAAAVIVKTVEVADARRAATERRWAASRAA
ncbi:hypothetical protein [Burkholderia sp. Ac-20365]|uniref:hypothetical protein n=1 Tax=Burkholderia sp. Ac-20365 TaxID=2703897 RepID=UPI00197C6940|nr:hypothetical protein [Burkholderia sp. Ac-20365]MBN3761292.1 hypothetical protein [Burkholderia sp. Ac-20365]